MPGTPNFPNRVLYHGDNLDFLRGINSETVHLIATDPPFNKNRDFHATPGSLSENAKFADRWSWRRDLHDDWLLHISKDHPEVWQVIQTAKNVWGNDMGAYLCWLGVRLLEMRRILRNDGSIYLHIDHTAHAWVKCLMDAIFGRRNFRNEIVWAYPASPSPVKKDFPRKHDTILRYSKSNKWTFNADAVRIPYAESSMERIKYPANASTVMEGTEILLHDDGKIPPSTWADIQQAYRYRQENTGYPTQKPLALYERIIKASSNPGEFVLDPFCGCATTPVAAERLGRQWIGMDIWDDAYATVIKRLTDYNLLAPEGQSVKQTASQPFAHGQVVYIVDPPLRTDAGETAALRLETPSAAQKGKRHPAPRTQHGKLLSDIGPFCQGCGSDYHFDPRVLEVDHRQPKSDGGTDAYENLTLLCPPCNKEKRDRLTLTGLQDFNRKNGYLKPENEPNIKHGRAGRQGGRRASRRR